MDPRAGGLAAGPRQLGLCGPGVAPAASKTWPLPPEVSSAAFLRSICKGQKDWLEPPVAQLSTCQRLLSLGLDVPAYGPGLGPQDASPPLLFLCTVSVACSFPA